MNIFQPYRLETADKNQTNGIITTAKIAPALEPVKNIERYAIIAMTVPVSKNKIQINTTTSWMTLRYIELPY